MTALYWVGGIVLGLTLMVVLGSIIGTWLRIKREREDR